MATFIKAAVSRLAAANNSSATVTRRAFSDKPFNNGGAASKTSAETAENIRLASTAQNSLTPDKIAIMSDPKNGYIHGHKFKRAPLEEAIRQQGIDKALADRAAAANTATTHVERVTEGCTPDLVGGGTHHL